MANFPAVTGGVGSIKPSGIQAVYIRESGGKWQTLGSIGETSLDADDFAGPDSLDRNKSNGAFKFTAKVRMKQASIIEAELLSAIVNGTNDFLFKLSDAGAVPTDAAVTAGWLKVTAAQVGCEGDLVCDGTPEQDQYIELRWQGTDLLTAKAAMLKASIDDNEFASTADSATAVFYAIGTYTAALDGGSPTNSHIKCCGVSSITLTDNAGGSTRTITPITNVKMTYKMLSALDDRLRFLPKSIQIDIEYEWMSTVAADLIVLHEMAPLDINVVVTMLNGMIFTLTNQVGIQTKFDLPVGGFEKTRTVPFKHAGKILQASLAAVISV